jgi:D-serine deaminase-like pyridoxal phosphate-dependent protein
MKNDWTQLNLDSIDSPALIIDQQKIRYNIKLAISIAGGTHRLRPHVKTHKMLEIAQMEIEEGIHKFKCATIPEAEMLGMARAEDVLIAYPVQGPKIDRVIKCIHQFPNTHFSVLVDHLDTAKEINDKFHSKEMQADVYIDLNNGQNRTGIWVGKAKELMHSLKNLPAINLIGLHCYDGHIRSASLEQRAKECKSAFKSVRNLRDFAQDDFKKQINLVAGGSPSFSIHAWYHDVECSPGTFVLWDARYAGDYAEQKFQKAAVLMTRVISKLDAHTYCLDLGHKSVASEFPFPRVDFITDDQLIQVGQSEEHLVVKSELPDALVVGQILLAYPYHICPTVALYDQVHVVNSGEITDHWEVIARNRKITI